MASGQTADHNNQQAATEGHNLPNAPRSHAYIDANAKVLPLQAKDVDKHCAQTDVENVHIYMYIYIYTYICIYLHTS